MSVAKQQEKLLEKLNLDGLSNWTPRNAAVAWDLALAFHDIFTLEGNELGCTSAVEHEICITDSEPFKEWFRHIPPLLLEEVRALLRYMLDAGAICPSQSPWCNAVVLVREKDGSLCFCMDFRRINVHTKKDSYPLPWIQEALKSMAGTAHLSTMISKVDSDKSRWCQGLNSTLLSQWAYSGVLQVYLYALWALQCSHDFPTPHAKHLGGAKPDILHHILG